MFSLNYLTINNFKLLKQADLHFTDGLTIISGTTGAGKSMFIGALQLISGAKASKNIFDLTNQKVKISAEFNGQDHSITSLLSEQSIDCEDSLILRREISPSGQNRCFINDTPVTVKFLAKLGQHLIDFHGQHEDQAVLKPSIQLEIIDRFADHSTLINNYADTYTKLQSSFQQLQEIRIATQEREDRLHLLRFKLQEIGEINPQPNELSELEHKVNRLKNRNQIQEDLQTISGLINENDNNVQQQLNTLNQTLYNLSNLDDNFAPLMQQSEEIINLVNDLSYNISSEQNESDFDENDFNSMQERLFNLKSLEKKFARSYDEVLLYQDEMRNELESIENIDSTLEILNKQIESYEKQLKIDAQLLSKSRKQAAKKIEQAVNKELQDLALKDASFKIKITSKIDNKLSLLNHKGLKQGFDSIIFTAQLNKGIPFAPIKDIASGGEAARIMLALKKVIGQKDAIGTLIFDEIDSDTGGRLGSIIGKKMCQIAKSHQVIAITHLPQVAAFGTSHLKVEKFENKDIIYTGIKKLTLQERQEELAQMMTGDNVTELARQHAKTLLEETGQL